MKIFEQSSRALPENLIRPLPVQDREDGGSGDLLSRSSVHVDARDGASYEDGAAARRGKTLTRLDCVLVEADRSNILKRPTSCRGRILKN